MCTAIDLLITIVHASHYHQEPSKCLDDSPHSTTTTSTGALWNTDTLHSSLVLTGSEQVSGDGKRASTEVIYIPQGQGPNQSSGLRQSAKVLSTVTTTTLEYPWITIILHEDEYRTPLVSPILVSG